MISLDGFCYHIQLSWPRNSSLNPEFRGLLFTTSSEEKSQEFSFNLEYSYAKATRRAEQKEYTFTSRHFCLNQPSLPEQSTRCCHCVLTIRCFLLNTSFKTSLIRTAIFSIPDGKAFGCCHTQQHCSNTNQGQQE